MMEIVEQDTRDFIKERKSRMRKQKKLTDLLD
jgi:hypothetical protein